MKNRTVIGIICIILALVVTFLVAPLVNKLSDSHTEIVRIKNDIIQGHMISENDVEIVTVGTEGLPSNIITKKEIKWGIQDDLEAYCSNMIPELMQAIEFLDGAVNGFIQEERSMTLTMYLVSLMEAYMVLSKNFYVNDEHLDERRCLENALDICMYDEKKLQITGRDTGCTCEEFGDYVMETVKKLRS